jgi:hypothetical protein
VGSTATLTTGGQDQRGGAVRGSRAEEESDEEESRRVWSGGR